MLKRQRDVIRFTALVAILVCANSPRTATYDFRHFTSSEGMTLSISKASPPLAALEDMQVLQQAEKILDAQAEPAAETVKQQILPEDVTIHPKPGQQVLVAGQTDAWRIIGNRFQKPVRKIEIESPEKASKKAEAFQVAVLSTPKDIRRIVDQPLKAPPVQRSLPKGEEPQPERQSKKNSDVAQLNPDPAQDPSEGEDTTSSFTEGNQGEQPLVTGRVEITGGLAVLGAQSELSVEWKGGGSKAKTLVDQVTGEFKLSVPSIKNGKLIALLKDETQKIVGRGEYDLEGAASEYQKLLQGVSILVTPVGRGIGGKVVSGYSTDNNEQPVARAHVRATQGLTDDSDSRGQFEIAGLSSNSTYLAQVEAQNHYAGQAFVAANAAPSIRIFSEKMISSLLDLVGAKSAGHQGIIWGEIKSQGRAISGAVVALSTAEALGPIYFNALGIPDRSLKATTDNGLFAYVKVKPGVHVVMAEVNKTELPSTVVSINDGYVGYARIENKRATVSGVGLDALTKQPMKATVAVVGASMKRVASEDGTFGFKVPSSDNLLFVEGRAESSDYYPTRVCVSRSEAKKLEMPYFKKDWLQAQLTQAGATLDENLGLLVGVVTGSEYHVSLDDDPDYADNNIYYFNEKGQLEGGINYGVAGGGFVLTNLPTGAHNLTIYSASGEIYTTKVFVAQRGVLNFVSAKFSF